jgi:hypothetical protein
VDTGLLESFGSISVMTLWPGPFKHHDLPFVEVSQMKHLGLTQKEGEKLLACSYDIVS